MNKKIILTLIFIFAIFVAFSTFKILTFQPKIIKVPVTKEKEIEELKIAALALFPFEKYPTNDVNLATRSVNTQIFEGLTYFDKNMELRPALAQNWDNPDNLTWRFYLRKNVFFQNGQPFTAADVKYTIEKTIEKNFYGKTFLVTFDKLNVIDDYTIEFKTKVSDPVFANRLAFVWIFNHDCLSKEAKGQCFGTGPYRLAEWEKDGKYVILERNENYWGQKPKAKKVIWQSYATDDERIQAIKEKKADVAYLIEGETSVKKAKEIPGLNVLTHSDTYIFSLGFDFKNDRTLYVKNVTKNPFKDLRVRKAIYQGINVEKVIQEAFGGLAQIQNQIVTKDVFGYNPSIERYPYDPQTAKKLLTEAGYPNGFQVNLDVGFYDEYIAKPIAQSLSEIGLNVIVTPRGGNPDKPDELDTKRFNNGDTSFYGTWLDSDLGDATQVLNNFFHSPDAKDYMKRTYGVFNTGYYSNSELDQLIDKINNTFNPKERLSLMQKANEIIHNDVAVIPLFTSELGYAINPDILFTPRPDSDIKASEISGKEIVFQEIQEPKNIFQIIFSR